MVLDWWFSDIFMFFCGFVSGEVLEGRKEDLELYGDIYAFVAATAGTAGFR